MARTLLDRINEIKTKHLSPQSVTGDKIADNAIAEKHIKDGSVTKAKIADGVIGKDEIADGAVSTPKIAGNAVTTDKVANSAITPEKVADGAITAPKIADNAITTAKIATGAITRDKVADKSVGTADLVDGAVTNPKIADNAVTQGKIAANSVGSSELIAGAVGNTELSSNAVTPPKVDAVNAPADGQVVSYEQATGKFKYVTSAGGITRPLIPPIENAEIAGDAVTAEKIATGAVTNAKIADRAVDWVKIALSSINHELLYNIAPPTDGQILSFDAATGKFNWIAPPTGGAGGMQLTLLSGQPLVFSENSMTDIDQLVDLSTQIPATAQAVLLEIQFNAMSVPVGMEQILTVFGRRAGMNFGSSTVHFIWQNIANLNQNAYKEATLAVDALRQIKVMITKSGQFCSTNVWVKGYIE
ncbi:MAG: hypothetical protein WC980_01600 [Candidatus Brocadiia bacterium]